METVNQIDSVIWRRVSVEIGDMAYLDACSLKQLKTVGDAVKLVEHHPPYSALDNQLGAFEAGRCRDIERGAGRRIVACRDLGDGIGLCVEHVWLGDAVGILAYIFKTGGCTVEAVGYYHAVFDYQCPHLPAAAVGVFGPNTGHAQIAPVESVLLDVHITCKISENSREIANFAVMNTQGERNVTGTPAIRLTGIGMRYGRKEVLDDITLDINRGDFVAITGPNGGGKTTLLRIMLKLLRPTAGSVSYLDSSGLPAPGLTIGYLPQKSAVDAGFPITVEEVIRLGLMGPEAPRDNVDARVAAMLARLELESKAGSPVGELSGGQFQRALLGRALVAEPEVVILDEPLSYLDKHFEHELYAMLQEVKSERPDTAIALVSHEMSEIAAMATRHVVIDRTLHVCHSATHLVHYDCDCNI